MSVNQSVLSALPSSVNASNAESGAKSALMLWKGASTDWNQETADAVGKASAAHALKWNAAVMSAIDEKIAKCKVVYEEKKAKYDEVKAKYDDEKTQYNNADGDMKSALEDVKSCLEPDNGTMITSIHNRDVIQELTFRRKIEDHIGFNAAVARYRKAESEKNRHEKSMQNWKNQMDGWKKQMNAAESDMKNAQKEKDKESKKIEDFLLGVFELNLMNESAEFLRTLKSSSIELSEKSKDTLFSRLFFIENKYRKQFDEFEKTIKAKNDSYGRTSFRSMQDSLHYSAVRNIVAKKFKTDITCDLISKDSQASRLSFTGKKDFFIPKNKLEGAQEKVQSVCKDWTLVVDRNNFTVALDKSYDNDDVIAKMADIDADFESYSAESAVLLDTLLESGASASKLRVLIGKIGNWHSAHWKKLWYKIVFCFMVVLTVLILAVAGLFIADSIISNKAYTKSFTEWAVYKNKETEQIRYVRKRFALSSDKLRTVYARVLNSESEIQRHIDWVSTTYERNSSSFVEVDEEFLGWLKENFAGSFPNGSETTVLISLTEYRGKDISKRSTEKEVNKTLSLSEGIFKITVAEDGSVSDITDLSGKGFFKRVL